MAALGVSKFRKQPSPAQSDFVAGTEAIVTFWGGFDITRGARSMNGC